MGLRPIVGQVETCVRCGAELGVGRFCLNCGHRIGAPAPAHDPAPVPAPTPPEVTARDPGPAPGPRWNPQEDLLPYDDVPRRGGDSGLRGFAWLAWVVGAALLVGLVVVLLRVYGVDSDDSDARSGQESAAGTGAGTEESLGGTASPETVGKAANVARSATFEVPSTAPETTDLDGELVGYEAAQMRDGVPATTWRMAGDGTGAVITITLRRPTVVNRVGLVNGYDKRVSGVHWYPHNRRVLAARWAFDDGSSIMQTLAERPDLQQVEVPPVLTGTVTLTIASVSAPGTGPLGRDYTAISEIVITGRQAR